MSIIIHNSNISSSSNPSAPRVNTANLIAKVPEEIVDHFLSFLPFSDTIALRKTSNHFRHAIPNFAEHPNLLVKKVKLAMEEAKAQLGKEELTLHEKIEELKEKYKLVFGLNPEFHSALTNMLNSRENRGRSTINKYETIINRLALLLSPEVRANEVAAVAAAATSQQTPANEAASKQAATVASQEIVPSQLNVDIDALHRSLIDIFEPIQIWDVSSSLLVLLKTLPFKNILREIQNRQDLD